MRGATGDTANDFVQSILQATRLEQKQHALPDAQLGCYFCIILWTTWVFFCPCWIGDGNCEEWLTQCSSCFRDGVLIFLRLSGGMRRRLAVGPHVLALWLTVRHGKSETVPVIWRSSIGHQSVIYLNVPMTLQHGRWHMVTACHRLRYDCQTISGHPGWTYHWPGSSESQRDLGNHCRSHSGTLVWVFLCFLHLTCFQVGTWNRCPIPQSHEKKPYINLALWMAIGSNPGVAPDVKGPVSGWWCLAAGDVVWPSFFLPVLSARVYDMNWHGYVWISRTVESDVCSRFQYLLQSELVEPSAMLSVEVLHFWLEMW